MPRFVCREHQEVIVDFRGDGCPACASERKRQPKRPSEPHWGDSKSKKVYQGRKQPAPEGAEDLAPA